MKSFKQFIKEDDIDSYENRMTAGLGQNFTPYGGGSFPSYGSGATKETLRKSWRRLSGKELEQEFHPKTGEIASQLKAHDEAIAAKKAGQKYDQNAIIHPEAEKGLRALSQNPDYLNKQLQSPREIYNKQRIKDENVLNTTGHMDWDVAKKQLTPERVQRAEQNRTGVQTSPTMVRVGKTVWNTGGNTRLSSMPKDGNSLVHVIDATPLIYPKK